MRAGPESGRVIKYWVLFDDGDSVNKMGAAQMVVMGKFGGEMQRFAKKMDAFAQQMETAVNQMHTAIEGIVAQAKKKGLVTKV